MTDPTNKDQTQDFPHPEGGPKDPSLWDTFWEVFWEAPGAFLTGFMGLAVGTAGLWFLMRLMASCEVLDGVLAMCLVAFATGLWMLSDLMFRRARDKGPER